MNKYLNELMVMLKMDEHRKMNYIKSQIDVHLFDIYEVDDMYHIFVPKNINGELPMICSHLDIIANKLPDKVLMNEDIIKSENEILGGDDGCGNFIMVNLMKSRPNDFIFAFFHGEERGCIGSSHFTITDDFYDIIDNVSCFIAVDRRGKNDLATYGYNNEDLIEIFEDVGYNAVRGSYTDVTILSGSSDIACVNLSVGYYNEHTKYEYVKPQETIDTLGTLMNLTDNLWNVKFKHDNIKEYNYVL